MRWQCSRSPAEVPANSVDRRAGFVGSIGKPLFHKCIPSGRNLKYVLTIKCIWKIKLKIIPFCSSIINHYCYLCPQFIQNNLLIFHIFWLGTKQCITIQIRTAYDAWDKSGLTSLILSMNSCRTRMIFLITSEGKRCKLSASSEEHIPKQ